MPYPQGSGGGRLHVSGCKQRRQAAPLTEKVRASRPPWPLQPAILVGPADLSLVGTQRPSGCRDATLRATVISTRLSQASAGPSGDEVRQCVASRARCGRHRHFEVIISPYIVSQGDWRAFGPIRQPVPEERGRQYCSGAPGSPASAPDLSESSVHGRVQGLD